MFPLMWAFFLLSEGKREQTWNWFLRLEILPRIFDDVKLKIDGTSEVRFICDTNSLKHNSSSCLPISMTITLRAKYLKIIKDKFWSSKWKMWFELQSQALNVWKIIKFIVFLVVVDSQFSWKLFFWKQLWGKCK